MTPRSGAEAPQEGRAALLVVGVVVLVAAAWMLRGILMLVAFSILVAYALDPLVNWMVRMPLPRGARLHRGVAAGLTIAALVGVVAWGLVVITPRLLSEAASFFTSLPDNLRTLDQRARELAGNAGLGDAAGPLTDQLRAAVPQGQAWLLGWIGRLFGNVLQVAGLLILPVLSFYLLAEREAVRASALRFVPQEAHPRVAAAERAVDRALASYVRGQAVVCVVSGAVMVLVFGVIRMPHALLLGLLVAAGEILPFFGFWLAAAAIVLVGLGVSPGLAMLGLGAYVVVNNLIGLLVTPRVMGRHLKMHPFVVTVSVLGGSELLGPAGVLLALPAAAIAQALVQEFGPRGSSRGAR